jgi:hypothetical protein
MLAAIFRFELLRLVRTRQALTLLLALFLVGFVAHDSLSRPHLMLIMLPTLAFSGAFSAWLPTGTLASDGTAIAASSYLLTRPTSRASFLLGRAASLWVIGGIFAALTAAVGLGAGGGALMQEVHLSSFDEIYLAEASGHEVTFRDRQLAECHERRKLAGNAAPCETPESGRMAAVFALSPWVMMGGYAWACLVLGGLYGTSREARSRSFAGQCIRHAAERVLPACILMAAWLLSLAASFGVVPDTAFAMFALAILLYPWVLPLLGALLAIGMFLVLKRRLQQADL